MSNEGDRLLNGETAPRNYSSGIGVRVRNPAASGVLEDPAAAETDTMSSRDAISTSGSEVSMSSEAAHKSVQDELSLLQACVFIEDAVNYRSIHHKVDAKSLRLYRIYYSTPFQWFLYATLFIVHILAFFEYPSSLTLTSDIRVGQHRPLVPCGVLETIELFCLLVLALDLVAKSYFIGRYRFLRSRWLLAYTLVISASLIDWCVSVGLSCGGGVRFVRCRRMLRPFFLLQNSSLMKKTFNGLRRTLPQVFSVLLLLFVHIYFFTLFGMLLFPKNTSDTEQSVYFSTLADSFLSLLVLLTTANNPDVMMPAYNRNRFYALYFIVFLFIGMYCFMNMLTAVIYNQFRGYFLDSMQASLFRRRLGFRAAYEVLQQRRVMFPFRSSIHNYGDGVPAIVMKEAVEQTNLSKQHKRVLIRELEEIDMTTTLNTGDFQDIFSQLEVPQKLDPKPEIPWVEHQYLIILQRICAHRYFVYFGCAVALANVICISIELATEFDHVRNSNHTMLGNFDGQVLNMVFVFYYMVEQILKVWALGWRRFCWDTGNVFEAVVTFLLVIIEGVYIAMYGIPFWGKDHANNAGVTLWDLVRIVNMLIMIRLLRIVTQIKAMSVVASTLFDLIKNMKSFAGILVVIYYSYAILGMELFRGKIKLSQNETGNATGQHGYPCGSYRQLEYWANNFDDFAAALVVLWDVMVVNNWHVFLTAYAQAAGKAAQIYFIAWWLLSVVIIMNLFTALILENFIMRWDRMRQLQRERSHSNVSDHHNMLTAQGLTIHDMFRSDLQEPSENDLVIELRTHQHLQVNS